MKDKVLVLTVFLFFLPQSARSTGLPIFDANEMASQLKDSIYLITVIDDLLNVTTGAGLDKEATDSYRREVGYLENEISKYNKINQNIEELSRADRTRSKVFAHQVRSLTDHIRRVKDILRLASTVGARPEAVSSSLKILNERRAKEKEEIEMALIALDAEVRVFEKRQKIKKERIRKESIQKELSFIRNGFIKINKNNSNGFELDDNEASVKEGLW